MSASGIGASPRGHLALPWGGTLGCSLDSTAADGSTSDVGQLTITACGAIILIRYASQNGKQDNSIERPDCLPVVDKMNPPDATRIKRLQSILGA